MITNSGWNGLLFAIPIILTNKKNGDHWNERRYNNKWSEQIVPRDLDITE